MTWVLYSSQQKVISLPRGIWQCLDTFLIVIMGEQEEVAIGI